jgi:hypothetical protein
MASTGSCQTSSAAASLTVTGGRCSSLGRVRRGNPSRTSKRTKDEDNSAPAVPGCTALCKNLSFSRRSYAASFQGHAIGFSTNATDPQEPWARVLFGGRARPSVAQLFKLLYRRFSTGTAFGGPRGGHALSCGPPITNRRYGRMQSCATCEASANPTPSAPAATAWEMCGPGRWH